MTLLDRILAFFGLALLAKQSGVLDKADVIVEDVLRDDNRDGLPDIGNLFAERLTVSQVYALAEQTSSRYALHVSPFFATVIASIESSFKPKAFRAEPHINDASYGLMQTLWRTAKDMESKGYNAFRLNEREDLYRAEVSMYYGMAYIDWLKRYFPGSDEEIARKYNGGPSGHTRSSTLPYLEKYRTRQEIIRNELNRAGVARIR